MNLRDLIGRIQELEQKRVFKPLMSAAEQNYLLLRALFCDSQGEKEQAIGILVNAVEMEAIQEGGWLRNFLSEVFIDEDPGA